MPRRMRQTVVKQTRRHTDAKMVMTNGAIPQTGAPGKRDVATVQSLITVKTYVIIRVLLNVILMVQQDINQSIVNLISICIEGVAKKRVP